MEPEDFRELVAHALQRAYEERSDSSAEREQLARAWERLAEKYNEGDEIQVGHTRFLFYRGTPPETTQS